MDGNSLYQCDKIISFTFLCTAQKDHEEKLSEEHTPWKKSLRQSGKGFVLAIATFKVQKSMSKSINITLSDGSRILHIIQC